MTVVENKKRGAIGVLKDYFGFLPGQQLGQFAAECKKLSDAEKLELARGAARNLGLKQDDVDFVL